ncbi:MAG: Fic family protein [Gammaproteobacteria bacterium]
MPVYHKWQPIAELESAPEVLADDGLRSMLAVWHDQKGDINPEALRIFNEKLRREWSVETGLIERIYTLDRGITEMLIERGIDAALIPHRPGRQLPEKTAAIIRDHKNVVDSLFDFVGGNRTITTSYIKELHAALVRNQDTATGVDQFGNKTEVPLVKGKYKTRPNNPTRDDGKGVHEYCPPEHTDSEMDRLIEINNGYTAKRIAPEVQAAWLHHRFTQIHPFQDGNGRVARCLATLIFLRAGGFPLTIRDINGDRAKYLDALEAADGGDLQPLISIFVAGQRREITRAIDISREVVSEGESPDEDYQSRTASIIKIAAHTLSARQDKQKQEWENARDIAGILHKLSFDMLSQVQAELDKNIPTRGLTDAFRVDAYRNGDMEDRGHYFRYQIIEVAKKFGYFANPGLHHEWARLILRPGGRAELLVSFHGVGSIYRGLLVCSASMFHRERTDAEDRQVSPAEELTDDVFQINYQDSEERVTARFRPWLGKALERGLAYWQKSL